MANKKTEIKKKKRTMYFEEKLFEQFSEICSEYKKSPSMVLNVYMKKIVDNYKKNKQE